MDEKELKKLIDRTEEERKETEDRLFKHEIALIARERGYTHIETDCDSVGCKIVFQDPKDKDITVQIMHST